jgi:uncharacterized membrane protein YcaP (DUF421 family)
MVKPFDPANMFSFAGQWQWLVEIAFRTLVIYLVLVVGLRLFGKRELGQMTALDLVLLLTLSNAVQNAMTAGQNTLDGGMVSAGVLLAANWLLTRFGQRLPGFNRMLVGEPTLLVHDGALMRDRMRREGVEEDELLMAVREHGFDDLNEIRDAVLEVDGTISIIPKDGKPFRSKRRRHSQRMR